MAGPAARAGKSEIQHRLITGILRSLTGAPAVFETDYAITDTPVMEIPITPMVEQFLLTEVMWYMNPTNAVTYRVYLLEDAVADDLESLSGVIFDTGAAQADSVLYQEIGHAASTKLPKIVELATPGTMRVLQDWSGAPGVTPGFIRVKGYALGK